MNKGNNSDIKNVLGKKAGFDIDEMKRAAEQGNIEDFLNKRLSADATSRLKSVLSDKEATQRLLSTPQAKELMKKLTKGQ